MISHMWSNLAINVACWELWFYRFSARCQRSLGRCHYRVTWDWRASPPVASYQISWGSRNFETREIEGWHLVFFPQTHIFPKLIQVFVAFSENHVEIWKIHVFSVQEHPSILQPSPIQGICSSACIQLSEIWWIKCLVWRESLGRN